MDLLRSTRRWNTFCVQFSDYCTKGLRKIRQLNNRIALSTSKIIPWQQFVNPVDPVIRNPAVRTSNADIQIVKSCLAANGGSADKPPFLNLSTVQSATRLSSSLCAFNHR